MMNQQKKRTTLSDKLSLGFRTSSSLLSFSCLWAGSSWFKEVEKKWWCCYTGNNQILGQVWWELIRSIQSVVIKSSVFGLHDKKAFTIIHFRRNNADGTRAVHWESEKKSCAIFFFHKSFRIIKLLLSHCCHSMFLASTNYRKCTELCICRS